MSLHQMPLEASMGQCLWNFKLFLVVSGSGNSVFVCINLITFLDYQCKHFPPTVFLIFPRGTGRTTMEMTSVGVFASGSAPLEVNIFGNFTDYKFRTVTGYNFFRGQPKHTFIKGVSYRNTKQQ
jgi:hypothetical protein